MRSCGKRARITTRVFEVRALSGGEELDAEPAGTKKAAEAVAAYHGILKLRGKEMYLKSIEIQGFKSFANKILFEFHNGITGIVGRTEAAKSNVADAVRLVLGEQRAKQLRGGSMQDVIFAGTELQKPLGFAYVAITLDNSDHQLAIDYDEVTVSRRLYRSGESEYKINGSTLPPKKISVSCFMIPVSARRATPSSVRARSTRS